METPTSKLKKKKKKNVVHKFDLFTSFILFYFFCLALNQVQHAGVLGEGVEEKLQENCQAIGMKFLSFCLVIGS